MIVLTGCRTTQSLLHFVPFVRNSDVRFVWVKGSSKAKEQASRDVLASSCLPFSLAHVTNQGTHQLGLNRKLDSQAALHLDKHRTSPCDRPLFRLSMAHIPADYCLSSIGSQSKSCVLKRRFGKDFSALTDVTHFLSN